MQSSKPDAEELGAHLRAHLDEILRMLAEPPDIVMRRRGWIINHSKGTITRRQAMRAQRRNKRATEASL